MGTIYDIRIRCGVPFYHHRYCFNRALFRVAGRVAANDSLNRTVGGCLLWLEHDLQFPGAGVVDLPIQPPWRATNTALRDNAGRGDGDQLAWDANTCGTI